MDAPMIKYGKIVPFRGDRYRHAYSCLYCMLEISYLKMSLYCLIEILYLKMSQGGKEAE